MRILFSLVGIAGFVLYVWGALKFFSFVCDKEKLAPYALVILLFLIFLGMLYPMIYLWLFETIVVR